MVWISDGIEDGASDALTATLKRITEGGDLAVIVDTAARKPLGLAGKSNVEKGLIARITSPGGAPRAGTVAALSGKGARLAEIGYTLGENEKAVEAVFDLPLSCAIR